MKKILIILFALCINIMVLAQPTANTRYWVGANGTSGAGAIDFTAATNWSLSSGGVPGASFGTNVNTNYIFDQPGTYYVRSVNIFTGGFISLGANVTVVFQFQGNTAMATTQPMQGVLIPFSSKLLIENLNAGTGSYTWNYSVAPGYESTINGELEIAATNSTTFLGGEGNMQTHTVGSTGIVRVTGAGTNSAQLLSNAASNWAFNAGANLFINNNNGNSFAATYDPAATVNLVGSNHTNGTVAKLSSSYGYGNIIVDLPNNSSLLPMFDANGFTIRGNLTLKNTGTAATARVGFITTSTMALGAIRGSFVLDNVGGTTSPRFRYVLGTTNNVSAVTNIDGNLEVQSSALIDLGNGTGNTIAQLNVGGNLINNGLITETGSSGFQVGYAISLRGTGVQTISGTGTYSNDVSFLLNNEAGFILSNNVTLSSGTNARLGFTLGKLNLNNNTLVIENGIAGAVFNASKNSYAYNGTLVRETTTARASYDFPVGTAQYYYPAKIVPTDAASNFSIRFYNNYPAGAPVSGNPADGTGLIAPYYWDIQKPSGSGADAITLGYTDIAAGVLKPLETKVVHLNGVSNLWDNLGGTALMGPGNCTPTPNCGFIDAADVTNATPWTDFSPFTFAGNVTVLPVDINSFTAQKINDNTNSINWRAACNVLNEATFEVQRSTNGTNFTTINTETATRARCASPFSYVDNYNATSAITYYRLRVTGAVGEAKYSTIAAVNNKGSKLDLVTVYPTIVKSNATLLVQSTQNNTTGVFVVTNAKGALVNKFTKGLNEGANLFALETSYLASGTYQLTAYINGEMVTTRFIKQ
jgi:hypothetical protein